MSPPAEDDDRQHLLAANGDSSSPESPQPQENGIEPRDIPGVMPEADVSKPESPKPLRGKRLTPLPENYAPKPKPTRKVTTEQPPNEIIKRSFDLDRSDFRTLSFQQKRHPAGFGASTADYEDNAQMRKKLGFMDTSSYTMRESDADKSGRGVLATSPSARHKGRTSASFTRIRKKMEDFTAKPEGHRAEHMNRPIQDIESSTRGEAIAQRLCSVPVIHPLSKFRNYWDFIVILLVIYTSIVLPVRTAFLWAEEVVTEVELDGEVVASDSSAYSGWTIMDLIIDFTFLFDVVLNFNTGYIREPDFVAILGRVKIAQQYCKGWFLFDVVSSLPLDLIIMQQSNTAMKLPRVLRLIRIFRLIKVLRLSRAVRYAQRLQIFASMSTFGMRITKLILLGMIFLHWNSCAQFLVAAAANFPIGCWVEELDIIDGNLWTQYSWALFMASSQMFCIGYGPTPIVLVQEAWMMMGSFIMGASLFAVFVGIITSVLISIDSISSTFYQKMEIVNQYMAHRKLPLTLRQRIRDSMEYKWRTRRALDEHAILQDMPSGLRNEVAVYTCTPLIKKVPFFHDQSSGFINSLVVSLQPEVFLSGEYIIREGMVAKEMFFLNTGSIKITKDGIEIITLQEGNYFGEIGILHHVPRSASCVAITDCEVFVLTKDSLHEVLNDFSDVKKQLELVAEERLNETTQKSRFISRFPTFIDEEDEEEESSGEVEAAK